MSLSDWSDSIIIVELSDEPAFSEDMDHLHARLGGADATAATTVVPQSSHGAGAGGGSGNGGGQWKGHVILNFEEVTYLNSSNLAQLLRLRKRAMQNGSKLRICSVNDSVWSVLMTTGLDGIFTFTENVATALASLQMEG